MSYRVIGKQPNSKMCLVCGLKNSAGLKAHFYELENGEIVALFTAQEEHQSYPGRLHGGIATAILDETIGRAILTKYGEMIWGVTIEFSLRFHRPVPLNEELRVVGRITKETERYFEGTGEIYSTAARSRLRDTASTPNCPWRRLPISMRRSKNGASFSAMMIRLNLSWGRKMDSGLDGWVVVHPLFLATSFSVCH